MTKHMKVKKMEFEETEQASETDMAGMSEWPDCELKRIMINILNILKNKVDSMQEQMGSVSREMKTLIKNQEEEILEINNTVTEIKNAFFSRLDLAEKISELDDMSIEFLNTARQRAQNWK